MNDLEASLGLEAVEVFWETFNKRHGTMKFLREQCKPFEGAAFFSEEDEGNVNCPHGFSITLKEPNKLDVLTSHLEKKTYTGKEILDAYQLSTKRFHVGHKLGDFPESEYVGQWYSFGRTSASY